jgi:hypothetical protein
MHNLVRGSLLLAALGLLSGCVAVWGGSYHIETEDASGGSIRYDHVLISERAVMAHANASCARFEKVAGVEQERYSVILPGGSVDEITYSCREPINKITETDPQFVKDRYACMQEARSSISSATVVGGFSTSNGFSIPGSGRSFSGEQINGTLYKACMQARGHDV